MDPYSGSRSGESASPSPATPPTRPGTAPKYARPTIWPTAVGILGCVGGSAVALFAVSRAFSFALMQQLSAALKGTGTPAATATIESMTEYGPLVAGVSILASLIAIALVIGSARMIMRRRDASLWIWSSALVGALAMCVLVLLEYQMQSAQFQAIMQNAAVGPGGPPPAMMSSFGTVSAAIGACFGVVLNGGPHLFMMLWLSLPFVRKEISSW